MARSCQAPFSSASAPRRLIGAGLALLSTCAVLLLGGPAVSAETDPGAPAADAITPPRPAPARRATPAVAPTSPGFDATAVAIAPPVDHAAAAARRRAAIGAATSWGYQLAGLDVAAAAAAPFDLLVVDATTGVGDGRAMTTADVSRLKRKPDGTRRLLVSYLSIGEAEDYRPDYFDSEYLAEDAPDWLMGENPRWKGNRIIRFCEEGWQRTILGDERGRSVYNSIDPSPLYRLVELGLDGVYLDRVDVYSEVANYCPGAAAKMVAFVRRLAEHARKRNPDFIVVLQNAEELLAHADMIEAIDAIAKEDLFYGVDHSETANEAAMVRGTIANLRLARAAGRPVFFVDYVANRNKIADATRRGRAEGFIPYFAPRALDRLWLPGRQF